MRLDRGCSKAYIQPHYFYGESSSCAVSMMDACVLQEDRSFGNLHTYRDLTTPVDRSGASQVEILGFRTGDAIGSS